MKSKKETVLVFVFQKHSKLWSILLEHFIKHNLLFLENDSFLPSTAFALALTSSSAIRAISFNLWFSFLKSVWRILYSFNSFSNNEFRIFDLSKVEEKIFVIETIVFQGILSFLASSMLAFSSSICSFVSGSILQNMFLY